MKVVRRPKVEEEPVGILKVPKGWKDPITRFDLGLLNSDKRQDVVIGIDSSATAPAIAALGVNDLSAFVWVLKPKTTGVKRLLDIGQFVYSTVQHLQVRSNGVKAMCMEGYAFGAKFNRELLGEVGGQVKVNLVRALGTPLGVPTIVSPDGLKKFTTGESKSQKSQMMLAVMRKWGVDLPEDNASDSYALSRVALVLHTGASDDLLAYEREVILKLEHNTDG